MDAPVPPDNTPEKHTTKAQKAGKLFYKYLSHIHNTFVSASPMVTVAPSDDSSDDSQETVITPSQARVMRNVCEDNSELTRRTHTLYAAGVPRFGAP